jgi:UDP-glucose 4-epimerase
MRIAVTGALGNVGRAVVAHAVAEGHSVVSIDRVRPASGTSAAGFRGADLTDYAATEQALTDCEAVVHLAAITGPGRHPDHVVHHTNVVSSYNVMLAAAELGIRRVCQASSVNAIGGRFSSSPRYDYFPVDEQHPAYPEDPYSLSKWTCEQQADAIARRYGTTIASLRLHGVTDDRASAARWTELIGDANLAKQLWGYLRRDAAARAFVLGVTAEFDAHEAFYIVAPDTMVDTPSPELAATWYPEVPVKGDLSVHSGFFDCRKAGELLGWSHDAD